LNLDNHDPIKTYPWLKLINPGIRSRLGQIRHTLFDFDGTISVMREGWEGVMGPLMIEMICGNTPSTPAIQQEVMDYIDRSTGILTTEQMNWLVETVQKHGLPGEPRSAAEYKALYLNRLMVSVRQRVMKVAKGEIKPSDQMIQGSLGFVRSLARKGITLYLASGTDHPYVVHEAEVLGLVKYFNGGVYGALDTDVSHNKAQVIQHILDTHHLQGNELMIVGDGPVEIREAVTRGAIALGIATDEINRSGWNRRKIKRLIDSGADILIPDFSHYRLLTNILFRT
jgi:phosphoglycolate phosphatase-like HAD superfamily hydrolase